jgi:hypothetical protein
VHSGQGPVVGVLGGRGGGRGEGLVLLEFVDDVGEGLAGVSGYGFLFFGGKGGVVPGVAYGPLFVFVEVESVVVVAPVIGVAFPRGFSCSEVLAPERASAKEFVGVVVGELMVGGVTVVVVFDCLVVLVLGVGRLLSRGGDGRRRGAAVWVLTRG